MLQNVKIATAREIKISDFKGRNEYPVWIENCVRMEGNEIPIGITIINSSHPPGKMPVNLKDTDIQVKPLSFHFSPPEHMPIIASVTPLPDQALGGNASLPLSLSPATRGVKRS